MARIVEEIVLKVKVDDKSANKKIQAIGNSAKKTEKQVSLLGDALKLISAGVIIAGLKNLGQEAIKVSNDFERAGLALKTAFGADAAAQMQFITAEAERLGVNVLSSAQGFAKLANSTKIAGISSKDTQEIFTATAEAATALGLSGDDVNGILRAFSQIASKGKVQAEELLQIAERGIPIQAMMADALGVSNEELQDMAQKGEILAVDALPKMAKAIRDTFHEGALANANSTMATNNRTMNLWQENLKLTGDELKNVTTPGLNTAARAWDGLTDMIADGIIDVMTFTGNIETLSGALADVRMGMKLEGVDLGGDKGSVLGIEVVELDKVSIAMSNFLDTIKQAATIDTFRESLGLTERGFVKIKDAIEALKNQGLSLDEMEDPLKNLIKGMKDLDQLGGKDLIETEELKKAEKIKQSLMDAFNFMKDTASAATFGVFGENLGDFDEVGQSKAQAPQAGIETGTREAAEFLVRPTEDTNEIAKESLDVEKKSLEQLKEQTAALKNQNQFIGHG